MKVRFAIAFLVATALTLLGIVVASAQSTSALLD